MSTKSIEFEVLMNIVEELSGVSPAEMISNKRSRPLTELRMICSNVLKEFHKITVEKIGEMLNRDHSTITYHLKTHKTLLGQKDGKYKNKYDVIKSQYAKSSIFYSDTKEGLLEKRKILVKSIEEIDEVLEKITNKKPAAIS